MKNFFKEYFSFSLSARRGIWVLIALIIILIFLPFVFRYLLKEDFNLPDKSIISEFDRALKSEDSATVRRKTILPEKLFDPNEMTKSDWLKMGVKNKVAENINRYLNKGGKFYKKEDLLKIYGFDTVLYKVISPYIQINLKPGFAKRNFEVAYNKTNIYTNTISHVIDINSADTIKLKELPGIGTVLSERIIKYRNMLGGFYSVNQLTEVYGFNNLTLKELSDKITVDTNFIKRIDLNTASEKVLKNHPYIGKYKAATIIKLRNFQKTGLSLVDLCKNGILSKEEGEKLKYYLK